MTDQDRGEVADMIAEAIRKHNRNASTLSAILGLTVLAFYSHGLITVVERLSR